MVRRILDRSGITMAELIGNERALRTLRPADFADDRFGVPTVTDILAELEKPGRDPRPAFSTATFAAGVEKVADLKVGMVLEGVVTNVAAFGAFVDVGVHQDGLVHVSAMSDRFVSDPHEVVRSGQVVRVKVVDVDVDRQRIGLTLRLGDSPKGDQPKRPEQAPGLPPQAGSDASPPAQTTAGAMTSAPPVRWLRRSATQASVGKPEPFFRPCTKCCRKKTFTGSGGDSQCTRSRYSIRYKIRTHSWEFSARIYPLRDWA